MDALNYAMQWSNGNRGLGYMIPIWVINNAEKYKYGEQEVEAKGVTGQKYSQLFYFRTHTPYIDPYIYESGNSRHVAGGAYVKDNYVMYSSGLVDDGNICGGGEDWDVPGIHPATLEASLTNLLKLYSTDNLNFGGAYLTGKNGDAVWSPISLKSFSKSPNVPTYSSFVTFFAQVTMQLESLACNFSLNFSKFNCSFDVSV